MEAHLINTGENCFVSGIKGEIYTLSLTSREKVRTLNGFDYPTAKINKAKVVVH